MITMSTNHCTNKLDKSSNEPGLECGAKRDYVLDGRVPNREFERYTTLSVSAGDVCGSRSKSTKVIRTKREILPRWHATGGTTAVDTSA